MNTPLWGPVRNDSSTWFRLWAPAFERIALELKGEPPIAMIPMDEGWHEVAVPAFAGTHVRAAQPAARCRRPRYSRHAYTDRRASQHSCFSPRCQGRSLLVAVALHCARACIEGGQPLPKGECWGARKIVAGADWADALDPSRPAIRSLAAADLFAALQC